MNEKPVTTRELAERLGITSNQLYRICGHLRTEFRLPAPLRNHRPFKWDRALIDDWFRRDYLAKARPHGRCKGTGVPALVPTTRANEPGQ